ncbi:MAG: pantoate--beta-alanine ligase, partial [Tannerella sp.]|nr:pantoate--beta-alanine ligase [Tannerella sp.]
ATYPRKPKQDCDFLEQAGCRYAFLPSVKEMYPEPDTRVFHLGKVAEIMEGAHRPGHFNGVAQIVSKLFFVVQPSRAYFGRKDFQQIAVIRAMVKELGLGVEIVPCPIVREVDGLAMSSRNQRLSPEERKAAPLIHAALVDAHEAEPDLEAMKLCVQQRLSKEPLLRVEYFEIVDEETLAPLTRFVEGRKAVGCIAVYCGAVRLIDNETYNN